MILAVGERDVLYGGRKHWIALVLQVLVIVCAVALFFVGTELIVIVFGLGVEIGLGIAAALGIAGCCLIAVSSLSWWSTALILTTHRILLRDGFIIHCTTVIPLSTIDKVAADCHGVGVGLDYGTLTLTGAGRLHRTVLTFVRCPEVLSDRISELAFDRREAIH